MSLFVQEEPFNLQAAKMVGEPLDLYMNGLGPVIHGQS